jgi:CRISPR/Cas system-associated exonuclease Cas4 (RecB family)
MNPDVAGTETKGVSPETPYLSHSRVNRYLHCPEQYRLYYVERWRPKIQDAALIFGQLVHEAIAQFFRTGVLPAESFANAWKLFRDEPLNYNVRDSWEIMGNKGIALLTKFLDEEVPRLGNVTAIEQSFTLRITSLDLALVGVIDLVAELDDVRTVIDFKTAASAYQDHDVQLSDQLTAYQLAEPDAEQVAFCVFVKTKEPRIDWYISARQPAHLAEYLAKTGVVAHAIAAGHFYKRPGKWCGYCDYLPVCLGDQQKVHETLVQVAPRS